MQTKWSKKILKVFCVSELDEFLLEMDEDTEGMQGTIVYLQDQLRAAKQQLQQHQALNTTGSTSPAPLDPQPPKHSDTAQEETVTPQHLIPDLATEAKEPSGMQAEKDLGTEKDVGVDVGGETVLASIEAQIIPGDAVLADVEHGSDGLPLTNGKKRAREGQRSEHGDGVGGDGGEPPCKRTKAIVLGEEPSSPDGEALENGS